MGFGSARHIDVRLTEYISPGDQRLDVLESFIYTGDRISPNEVCEVTTIARVGSVCGKFYELIPLFTNQAIPLKSTYKRLW